MFWIFLPRPRRGALDVVAPDLQLFREEEGPPVRGGVRGGGRGGGRIAAAADRGEGVAAHPFY